MSSNIDNDSIVNSSFITESDKDNELLKNQQSDIIIEPMEEVIMKRPEMVMPVQGETKPSVWKKYKFVIIALIVLVVVGVGLGIYFYMQSKNEAGDAGEPAAPGEAAEMLIPKSTSGTESSAAASGVLESPSQAVVTASPTSAKPADVVAPSPTSAGPEVAQVGGLFIPHSIQSSSSPLTSSEMPFLSLFKF